MVYTIDSVRQLESLNMQLVRELEEAHANIQADCVSFMIAKNKADTMNVYFDMDKKLEACQKEYARFFHEMNALKKRAAGLM